MNEWVTHIKSGIENGRNVSNTVRRKRNRKETERKNNCLLYIFFRIKFKFLSMFYRNEQKWTHSQRHRQKMNTVENRTKSNKTHTNKRYETKRNSRRMEKKQPMAITHKLRFIFHFLLNLFLVISSPVSIAIHWRNCLWKCGYTQRLSCNNFAERRQRFAVRKLQKKYAFDRKHRWLFRLRVFNSIIAVATKKKEYHIMVKRCWT